MGVRVLFELSLSETIILLRNALPLHPLILAKVLKRKTSHCPVLDVKSRFPRPIYGDGFYPMPATFPENVMNQH
jgi:hypothetical protein